MAGERRGRGNWLGVDRRGGGEWVLERSVPWLGLLRMQGSGVQHHRCTSAAMGSVWEDAQIQTRIVARQTRISTHKALRCEDALVRIWFNWVVLAAPKLHHAKTHGLAAGKSKRTLGVHAILQRRTAGLIQPSLAKVHWWRWRRQRTHRRRWRARSMPDQVVLWSR